MPGSRRCCVTPAGGSPGWCSCLPSGSNRNVRFHAAQSLIVFGVLSVALFLCGGASAVAFFVAVPTFQLLQAIGNALWLGAVVLWLFLLVKTWRGETWRVPVAGDLAVKLAAYVERAEQHVPPSC